MQRRSRSTYCSKSFKIGIAVKSYEYLATNFGYYTLSKRGSKEVMIELKFETLTWLIQEILHPTLNIPPRNPLKSSYLFGVVAHYRFE